MNYENTLKLMEKYANCPICSNDKIGNGQGGLIIDEDTLTRFCKCGFYTSVDENNNEVKIFCSSCNSEIKRDEVLFCENCFKDVCFTCYEQNNGYCKKCNEEIK